MTFTVNGIEKSIDSISPVGPHYLPGIQYTTKLDGEHTVFDMFKAPIPPKVALYLGDDFNTMIQHIEEDRYPAGTIIIARSTRDAAWRPGLTAGEALRGADDYINQKSGNRGYKNMESVAVLARSKGITPVWQFENEQSGGSFGETLELCKFALERGALGRDIGWGCGALALSVGRLHYRYDKSEGPFLHEVLVDSGVVQASMDEDDFWLLQHYYGLIVSEALMYDNQLIPRSENPSEEEIAARLFSTSKDEITAAGLMSGQPAYRAFEHLTIPDLVNANIIISEWHPSDGLQDAKNKVPAGGWTIGHAAAWAYVKKHYPKKYASETEFLLDELNFKTRMAANCPGKVYVLGFSFGQATKSDWVQFDWQPIARIRAYFQHVLNFDSAAMIDLPEEPEEPPIVVDPPTPPSPTPDTSPSFGLAGLLNDPEFYRLLIKHGVVKTETLEAAIAAKG